MYSADEFYEIFPRESGFVKKKEMDHRSSGHSSGGGNYLFGGGGSSSGGEDSGKTSGKSENDGMLRGILIALAIVVISVIMVKYFFIDSFGTIESIMAWASVIIGAVLALIFSKNAEQSILTVGVSSCVLTWVCDLISTYMSKGGIRGKDFLVEVIFAPILLLLVYTIPALLVGCLVSLIKGHFKRDKQERKALKEEKKTENKI